MADEKADLVSGSNGGHMIEHSAEKGLRPGDVIKYAPDPSRHSPRWCREGMAIVNVDGAAFDTYWGSGSDNHRVQPIELATARVVFNLADYDELDRYAHSSMGIWDTYHPDDRRLVTSQHRLQFRWFVRKGATPDLSTQIANAEEKLREAEASAASAQRQVEWAREDLAALMNAATPARD